MTRMSRANKEMRGDAPDATLQPFLHETTSERNIPTDKTVFLTPLYPIFCIGFAAAAAAARAERVKRDRVIFRVCDLFGQRATLEHNDDDCIPSLL